MDGWTAGPTQARIQNVFVRGVQARGPEYRICTWDQYTHTRMYRQAHECSCTGRRMDIHVYMNTESAHGTNTHTHTHVPTGKLKDMLFKTCIIIYRDNVRNIHVRACRGKHTRVIILKFPMKMNDLVPSRPTYFIFIGYLKTGAWRRFEQTS